MKRIAIAAAMFGLFAIEAHADAVSQTPSVDIYGRLEAGGMYQNRTTTGGSNLGFVDGQMESTIFGLKGSRSMPDGMSAGFTLEGGVSTGNGQNANSTGASSDIFGREANVTLGGPWGTIGAGMQMDPALIASVGTEPRQLTNSFSLLSQWVDATIFNGAGAGASGSLQGGIFDQNAFSYTYAKNGLYVGIEHALGGVSGSASANTSSSIGLSYTRSGFTGSFSYALANSRTPGVGRQSQIVTLGGAYAAPAYAVRAQIGEFQSGFAGGVAAHDVRTWGIGLDIKTLPSQVLNLAYYSASDKGAAFGGSGSELALMDTYDLFKDTQVYGQIAAVRADANAGYAAAYGGIYTAENGLTSAAGTTTFIGAGVRYSF